MAIMEQATTRKFHLVASKSSSVDNVADINLQGSLLPLMEVKRGWRTTQHLTLVEVVVTAMLMQSESTGTRMALLIWALLHLLTRTYQAHGANLLPSEFLES